MDVLLIFSRCVVGWLIADRESGALAEQLVAETCAKQHIEREQLTIHADNSGPMIALSVALLMTDLGVRPSHSRPHVSNDNPFSEAQFKTLKYQPDYPERFGSLLEARTWARSFFRWYNDEHHHSGIGFMTPAAVHSGTAARLYADRQHTLSAAYAAHPERFVKDRPLPPPLPSAVWINPPKSTTDPAVVVGLGTLWATRSAAKRCPQVHSLPSRKEPKSPTQTVPFDSKFSTQLSHTLDTFRSLSLRPVNSLSTINRYGLSPFNKT